MRTRAVVCAATMVAIALGAGAGGAGAAGPGAAPRPAGRAGPPEDVPSLFVLRGPAEVDGRTLEIDTRTVDWFTDRPERRAGRMTVADLVARWDEWGFDDVAPNAAVAGDDVDAVVELADPVRRGRSVAFRTSRVGRRLPQGALGDVSVFLDSTGSTTAPTTMQLTAQPNPATAAQDITVTVSISCWPFSPSGGAVTFSVIEGGNDLLFGPPNPVTVGEATPSTTLPGMPAHATATKVIRAGTFPAGQYTLHAVFSGGGPCESASAVLTQGVTLAG